MTALIPQATLADELRQILEEGLVRSVYQPIVDIDTKEIVAYEALARGPQGSPLERPDLLFATAHAAGVVEQLEWACRAAALSGALEAGLRQTLFVNVEPSLLDAAIPPYVADLLERAGRELDVVLELTERALTDRPAEMLARVDALRGLGLAIALDDVGADRRSLALMPFVRPDVIKLDLRLVQENPTPAIAAIVHAVNAEAERSGAVLLAEGIETEEQREVARALGARYGQGWLFGRPGALPETPAASSTLLAPRHAVQPAPSSPYDAIAARIRPPPRHQTTAARDLQAPRSPGRRPGRGRRRLRHLPGGPPLHLAQRRPLRTPRLPRRARRSSRLWPRLRTRPRRPRRVPRRRRSAQGRVERRRHRSPFRRRLRRP